MTGTAPSDMRWDRMGAKPSPVWIGLGILLLVAGAAFHRAAAQSVPAETTPITDVRADADDDLVPDRVGDTVTVRGRTTARQNLLPATGVLFLQDSTAGLAVQLPDTAAVERGDSLRVRGIVRHRYGLTQLEGLTHDREEAESRTPAPRSLSVTSAAAETYEGQLVRVRGRVVANQSNEGGRYLLLSDPHDEASARISAFVPNFRLARFDFDQFEVGEEVVVTGPLSQHDYSSPHNDYYQVLPRTPEDLTPVSGLPTYVRTLVLLLVAGGVVAAIAVFTLRTVVKRRTRQLAESRARFRRLAEATSEGIILHEDDEIVDVNRALVDMTGHDRADLIGRSFSTVLSENAQEMSRDGAAFPREEPYEAVVVRADGTRFPAEIEEKVVEGADRRVGVVAIRDITDQKQWEKELLAAKDEAERMAQLKSHLLNNMSHELRTPITSIIGYADLILEEPDANHHDFAARIRESGNRLSRTLRSVLEMAQLESGTLEVHPYDVDGRSVVQEVVAEHRSKAEDKGLTLDVREEEPVPSLHTDRALLYRVVSNLVENAIKFTNTGHVQVTIESAGSGIRIAVSDTGIGIDPDFRHELFEPFTQESEGRTRTHEGTGLGLALTKRMVDLLGGAIDVESTQGEGSRFVVVIPPIRSSEAADPVGASSQVE